MGEMSDPTIMMKSGRCDIASRPASIMTRNL